MPPGAPESGGVRIHSGTTHDNMQKYHTKVGDLPDLMRLLLECDVCPVLSGPPGGGKTEITRKLAADSGRRLFTFRLSQHSPTDIGGLPYLKRDPDRMAFAPMDMLPTEPGGLVFFDEYGQSSKAMKNASQQLASEGRCGAYVLPDDTWVVFATNRREDRSFSEGMSAAFVNRVAMIYVEADPPAWVKWAGETGLHPLVIGFIRFHDSALMDFDATTWDGESGFGSPRAWEHVSKFMQRFPHDRRNLLRSAVNGTLGYARGTEFLGFVQHYDALPTWESVLLDPAKAKMPSTMEAQIAVAAMFVDRVTPKTIGKGLDYISRMLRPIEIFTMRALLRKNNSFLTQPAVACWVGANKDAFIEEW